MPAAKKAAEEAGHVEIYWNGPLTMNDREGQINIVQNYVAQGVDGVVLAPIDRTALVPYVADAKRAGIPTVIIHLRRVDTRGRFSGVARVRHGATAGRLAGSGLRTVPGRGEGRAGSRRGTCGPGNTAALASISRASSV